MLRLTRLLLIIVLVGVHSSAEAARMRSVGRSKLDRASRILVVTAHPDDEVLLAPLLALRCVRDGAHCSLLVMTRGEGGVCLLAGGCAPSLADVRTAEMARSAAFLHASLTQWSFPDVGPAVEAAWAAHAGGRDVLLRQLADAITLEAPDVVITFSPIHGSTGHEAHRAIGALVREISSRDVWTIETVATIAGDAIRLANGAPGRANALLAGDDWQYFLRVIEIHESQFTPGQLETLRTLPLEQRAVWWSD